MKMVAMRPALALVVAAALACGCTETASGPDAGPDVKSITADDPSGDAFHGQVHWDLTALTIARDPGGLTVTLEFTIDAISPMTGDSLAMIGYVDLDVDEDSATGSKAITDEFRPDSGSTGLGVDYRLALLAYEADSTVGVYDSLGREAGRVKPVFEGKRVTIRIPRGVLGDDDGRLNAAAIVGIPTSPSDIVPGNGHLHLGSDQ